MTRQQKILLKAAEKNASPGSFEVVIGPRDPAITRFLARLKVAEKAARKIRLLACCNQRALAR